MSERQIPFAEAVRKFYDAEIRFVVIGGVALAAHGSNYATKDVDFAYAVDLENVERLAAFLPTIHARVAGHLPVITSSSRRIRYRKCGS